MERNSTEPETIDVQELMKDLEEDDDVLIPMQPSSSSSAEPTAKSRMFPYDDFILEPSNISVTEPAMRLGSDSFTREPSIVKEAPTWLSSFPAPRSFGMSSTRSPVERLSRDIPQQSRAQRKSGSTGVFTSNKSDLLGVSSRAGSTHESLAELLRGSLSIQTSPKKEMKRISVPKDGLGACNQLSFDADAASLRMPGRPLWERESVSSPSTPSFSESVSLKKRFQEDARRSRQSQEQNGRAAQQYETLSKPPSHERTSLPPVPKAAGPIHRASGGSYDMRSYDESDVHHVNAPHQHVFSHQMPSGDTRQGHSTRRLLRHSFTGRDRNTEPSETGAERHPSGNNRASSLELEKGKSTLARPKGRVVLYSTSSMAADGGYAREESNAARAILVSIVGAAALEERSVSEHPEYEQELKRALNTESALVPTVCAKGRYITGLDNLMQLYKKGRLAPFLADVDSTAQEVRPDKPCICRGGKFLICPVCKGKRKRKLQIPTAAKQQQQQQQGEDKEDEHVLMCRHCSGTGLIKCPNCLHSP